MPPTIDELVLAAEPDAWTGAGFALEDRVMRAGTVRLRLAGVDAGHGIVSWSLRDAATTDLDGLPTDESQAALAEPAPGAPATFWGLVFVVADLDAAGAVLGDRLGPARDAVQPGRRIATVRREAGLGLPVALITV